MKPFLICLSIINALAFLLMLIDKRKAQQGKWRISEAALIGFAVLGGSLGTLIGMYLVRHKTRHRKFTVGVPVILIIQILIILLVYRLL